MNTHEGNAVLGFDIVLSPSRFPFRFQSPLFLSQLKFMMLTELIVASILMWVVLPVCILAVHISCLSMDKMVCLCSVLDCSYLTGTCRLESNQLMVICMNRPMVTVCLECFFLFFSSRCL